MIIDCLSDTHGHLPKLDGGDLLIIAGDLTRMDRIDEYEKFDAWLRDQQYRKKVIVAGNHDNHIQNGYKIKYGSYLEDSGTEFMGFNIWGSPWTNRFDNQNPKYMAFSVEKDEDLSLKWNLIPNETNILVTHTPPLGILDAIEKQWQRCGSKSLSLKLGFSLRLHVFGHIHEGYGQWKKEGFGEKNTIFVNASHVNALYEPVNPSIRVHF